MMDWQSGHMAAGGWLLMSLVIVLLAGLSAAVIIVLFRAGNRRPDGASARALLDERLARGEIDVDEYRARRDLLG